MAEARSRFGDGRRRRPASGARGFTILEILIAIMLISLGVMGLIAFFSLGMADGNRAVDLTRASMIARDVRAGLELAMRFPVRNPDRPPLYRFEYPAARDAQLNRAPGQDSTPAELRADDPNRVDGFYFYLTAGNRSTDGQATVAPFEDRTKEMRSRVLDLPLEGFSNGATLGAQVWQLKDILAPREDDLSKMAWPDLDQDSSHVYSFRILIRKALPDPEIGPSRPNQGPQPGDIFDVTVYVFRDYIEGTVEGGIDQYDEITGEALFVDARGNEIPEIQPILTYRFSIAVS
jgi:prepilin-type N-terminal cleavage/methylation domain-containing protein